MRYVAMVQSKLCYDSSAIFPSLLERERKLQPASSLNPLCVLSLSCTTRLVPSHYAHASSLFTHYYTAIVCVTGDNHRLTRGQEARLLSIPFLPGPVVRASIQFSGAIGWYLLCPAIWTSPSVGIFKARVKRIRK